jgi:hypothetical protein
MNSINEFLPDLTKYLMSTLGLIPIPVLYLLYRRTGIKDYLIFAGVFFFFSSSIFFSILAQEPYSLLFLQLRHITMYCCYLLIFMHASRLAWPKYPKFLTIVLVTWFITLIGLTLLWESMSNGRGLFLFWEMESHSMDRIFDLGGGQKLPEIGAGLAINGAIIYSTSHPTLAYIFYFLVACIFLYVIITQKLVNPTPRIIVAKRLWIVIGFANLAATGLLLFWPLANSYELSVFFVITELVLIATAAIKYPESMLITQVQLFRAIDLYKKFQEIEKTDYRRFSEIRMEKVVNYLKAINMEDIKKEIS